MRLDKLLLGALVCGALGLASAQGKTIKNVDRPPAPAVADLSITDPTEPPLRVETDGGQAVPVASGARGTTLTVPTNGSYTGSANVTFKNTAVPMRLQMRLTHLQAHIALDGLSLNTGTATLRVGLLSAAPSTTYFDLLGRTQSHPEQAAYALTVSRAASGEVAIQLRRAAGTEVGTTLNISWSSPVYHGKIRCG